MIYIYIYLHVNILYPCIHIYIYHIYIYHIYIFIYHKRVLFGTKKSHFSEGAVSNKTTEADVQA